MVQRKTAIIRADDLKARNLRATFRENSHSPDYIPPVRAAGKIRILGAVSRRFLKLVIPGDLWRASRRRRRLVKIRGTARSTDHRGPPGGRGALRHYCGTTTTLCVLEEESNRNKNKEKRNHKRTGMEGNTVGRVINIRACQGGAISHCRAIFTCLCSKAARLFERFYPRGMKREREREGVSFRVLSCDVLCATWSLVAWVSPDRRRSAHLNI